MADAEFHALTAPQRKAPIVLDASPDAVLRALEAFDAEARQHG